MKSFTELSKIVTDAMEATIVYEVETDINKDGGWYFSKLSEAYLYLSNILRQQTDIKFFECEDFEEIAYIRVAIHFVNDERDIIPLVDYVRKSPTEFLETVLI